MRDFDDQRADEMAEAAYDARPESAVLDQRAEELAREEPEGATISKRAARGEQVLDVYAVTYYPGAERTDDADGAYTVAGDVIADLLHRLDQLGHEDPERVLDLARSHFSEERDACPECGTALDVDGYCVDPGCRNVGKAVR